MKKTGILLGLLLLLCAACKPKIDYAENIQGRWFCQEVAQDGGSILVIPTDEAFTLQFTNEAKLVLSKGCVLSDDAGDAWMENADFSYIMEDKNLLITGKNNSGEAVDASFTIEQLSSGKMVGKENYCKVQGTDVGKNRTFHFSKITKDFTSEIVGSWEVRKVSQSSSDTLVFAKYLFYANQNLDIYNLSGSEWVKSDMTADYFLNGELLSLNFESDPTLPYSHNYRCWLILSASEDQILIKNWQSISGTANLQGTIYELKKVNY